MSVLERGYKIMKQETFKSLELEKQVELYNQWLTDSKLEQYELYTNDNDGLKRF